MAAPSDGRNGGHPERHYHGLGVSRGVAIGTIHWHDGDAFNVPEYRIAPTKIGHEIERLKSAVDMAQRQVDDIMDKVQGLSDAAGEEVGYLLDAYRQMLHGSRLIRGVAH